MENLKVGIDQIGMYIPKYYVDMEALANYRQIDPNKWLVGIGQKEMAMPDLATDVVTMAANAARKIVSQEDCLLIDQVIVGSESGVDQSKSIATFVHHLLNIQPQAKAYEIKQACYGATAALQLACDYVRLRPSRKVLVIATDIAKYGLNSGGEPTQGAGAVAMLISANPRLMYFETDSYLLTDHQYDFWRPNSHEYALVDGKYSTLLYQSMFIKTLNQFKQDHASIFNQTKALVCHLPFTKMGKKAFDAYQEAYPSEEKIKQWQNNYYPSTLLNARVGNIYTGSLFLSLISLLYHDHQYQDGDTISLFSYGSGAVAELFVGHLADNYRQAIDEQAIEENFSKRQQISIQQYEDLFLARDQHLQENFIGRPPVDQGFYLEKIEDNKRFYQFNHN